MRDGARHCDQCGGEHRMMEICPKAPGYLDLLKMWGAGNRSFMPCLAVTATLILLFLVLLAAFAA